MSKAIKLDPPNFDALAALYFKIGDEKTSNTYIKKLIKAIPDIFEALFDVIDNPDSLYNQDKPYYQPGSADELKLALRDHDFILASSTGFLQYLSEHIVKHEAMRVSRQSTSQGKGKNAKKAKGGKIISIEDGRK